MRCYLLAPLARYLLCDHVISQWPLGVLFRNMWNALAISYYCLVVVIDMLTECFCTVSNIFVISAASYSAFLLHPHCRGCWRVPQNSHHRLRFVIKEGRMALQQRNLCTHVFILGVTRENVIFGLVQTRHAVQCQGGALRTTGLKAKF